MPDIDITNVESDVITEATPVTEKVKDSKTVIDANETAEKIQKVIDSFDEEPTEAEKEKSKNFLHGFLNYIQSDKFKKDIEDSSQKYNVPKKKLATTVIGKILGTIGDVLGLAIDAVHCTISGVVNLIASILNGAVNIICKVANKIARIFTFNMTAFS